MTEISLTSEEYSPAQQKVLDQLGAMPGQRPTFEADLGDRLRMDLDDVAVPLANLLDDDESIWVSKRHLTQVMACEARYLADLESDFEWSVPIARGTISHKAVELSVHWPVTATPLDLVDEAMAKLEAEGNSLGLWMQGLADADRAELRNEANNRVAAFVECWPPLKRQWRPVLESPARVELAAGKIILAGKVDLSLGRADGLTAGKVLVDLKTGGISHTHQDDLRFYALLETLRLGTPPRRIATYYLDQGRFTPEEVSVALLESAVARTCAAMTTMVELRTKAREATPRPGAACRWCPINTTCEPGVRHLSHDGEDDWGDLDQP